MRQNLIIFCASICFFCTSIASAQNMDQRSTRSWQPPAIEYNVPQSSAATAPRVGDVDQWWPPESVHEDENIRTASHEFVEPKIDPSLPQVGGMISNLKDGANEKIAGLMGSIEADGGMGKSIKDKFAGVDVRKMFGSLAIVLGGYFGFVWLARRFGAGSPGKLPCEVLDVIGSTPFGPRKNLQLVRLGTKLLLLINGPEGTHSIGEITDPAEVEHLASLCSRRGRTKSNAAGGAVFKNILGRIQTPVHQPASQAVRPTQQYSQTTPPQTPPTTATTELEQIIQRLSNVVQQSSGRNVFEA